MKNPVFHSSLCTTLYFLFILIILSTNLKAQEIEIVGKAKITVMDLHNTADSVVVVLPDGTLARRDVSTLSEFQILSISNDTIYLTNGGFVKLPPDKTGGWTGGGNAVRLETITDSVGIGTSTPTAKLDVVGETKLTGNVEINSTLTIDTDAIFLDGTNKQVGIGTETPNASSALDINTTSMGFLPPRMTSVQRDAILNPAEGLAIYNTTTHCFEFYKIAGWHNVCSFTQPINTLIGGSGDDIAYNIQQTADGGYVVAGSSTSSTSGDVSGTSNGANDYWIVKLDSNGGIIWNTLIGGSDF